MDVAISEIKIGKRHRKDMGDIPALAMSIEAVGLLHPVVLLPDYKLVVGARRVAAYKHLKREKIPVTIAKSLTELTDLIQAEADENVCRKDFSPIEQGAIFQALLPIAKKMAADAAQEGKKKGGGDRKSSKAKNRSPESSGKAIRDHSKEASAIAAKAAGCSAKTAEKIVAVVESGDKELIAEMEKTGKVDKAARKLAAQKEDERQQAAAKAAPETDLWTLTDKQDVVTCQALITDPPYGILDEPWEPKKLEKFTRAWATRWATCGADFIAAFWSQRHLWDGRQWFDECFTEHRFQQLLVWHYANNKSPQSRQGFKQTWEPIFFYRRKDSEKEIKLGGGTWGEGLNDFDCHVAAVPQGNFNAAERKVHPAQKPVSVMAWLVNALTVAGELVADPFCGSGTTGIATMQLGRRFHGIETDPEYRALAKQRIVAHGIRQL